jgi:hypothetical protein
MEPQIAGECNRTGNFAYNRYCHAMTGGGARMSRVAVALVLLVFGPAAASASQQGVVAITRWKLMDKCAVQAQAAFPDFTAEANAKRDAKLKECLAGQNLPPREPVSPPR